MTMKLVKLFALAMLVLVTTSGIQMAFAHEVHNTNAANSTEGKAPQSETRSSGEPVSASPAEPITEFPTLHPLVVHFPIMLIILAAAFQIVSLFVFRREMGWSVVFLALLGAIGAYLSSNVFHPHTTGLTENAQRLLVEHELFAAYTFWLAAAGLVLKIVSQFLLDRRWWSEAVVTVVLVGAAVAVAIAGHHGAELVHKEGVGPRGNFLEMHDH